MELKKKMKKNEKMRDLKDKKMKIEMEDMREKKKNEYGFKKIKDGKVLRKDKS